ncbi:MAG: NTP transferase domain-containing protein, partial [Lentisphaeria bacterium]|nr:NTP transferase domain-containing protein [Lentisphaeria bacterium]
AGAYRRFNSQILPGQVIIAGTNQGLFARTHARSGQFVIHSTLADGSRTEDWTVPMEPGALLAEAAKGEFFSYAAGVAYHMLTFYHVDGIEIDNYRTTLPISKGLSSSAAVCVMVAHAFNCVYDLKLTVRAEMEAAYQGEILTPSRCGRMDQGCAFGQVSVLMTFDGELLKTTQLGVGRHLHFLIADLKSSKDTITILQDLNKAFPFADDSRGEDVQKYLGEINSGLVPRAVAALKLGDAKVLGELMTEAQAQFDKHMIPASPRQLEAKKLHEVLNDPRTMEYVYGGKGVGSQGDGCVQFVARSAMDRDRLAAYLTEQYGLDCFPLDLKPPKSVRKAVIPAAGFGTRMFPATKAVKKELLPLVTPDGVCKPIIQAIAEEAVQAGCDEIAIIVRPDERALFESFFQEMPSGMHYNKLPDWAKRECDKLRTLGERITFIDQPTQEGFGHAVYCASEWVGNEPCLLLLGDHIYHSNTDTVCARQLIDAFSAGKGRSVVAVYLAPGEEVCHYGTVTGEWLGSGTGTLEVTEFAEKPSLDYARNHLVTPGLEEDQFVCVYGQYVLTPIVFEHLRRQIESDQRERGEIQLTSALESVRQEEGLLATIVDGEHFDTGLPGAYLNSIASHFVGKPVDLSAGCP